MKISLDFDSTMCGTTEIWIKHFHEIYCDKPIPRSIDVKDYDLITSLNLNPQQVQDLFNTVRYNKSLKYASPTDSSFYVWINRLKDEGHEISCLTANPPETEEYLKYWLSKYGLEWMPINFVKSPQEKLDYDWDILVDDAPKIYEVMSLQRPSGKHLLLYNNPWNADLHDTDRICRVYNFRDVYLVSKNIWHEQLEVENNAL